MFQLAGVNPALPKEERLDAASEGPNETGKPRSRALARQARKLKNVFKRQELEVQSSSKYARLRQRHGKPLQEMQDRENTSEHDQSSTERLSRSINEYLHKRYGNTLASSPLQVPNHVAPASTRSDIPNQELNNTGTRPEEPTQPDDIDPSSLPLLPQIHEGFHRTSSLPISTPYKYPESSQPQTSQETKRRHGRESHNLVERRRRDNINEMIQQLSRLVPLHRFIAHNAKHAQRAKTGDSLHDSPAKGEVLHETVNWTRDLLGALYKKIQQQDRTKEYIDSLGGIWPFESSEDERRLQNEVIDAFDANGKTLISSRPWDSGTITELPFEMSASAVNAKGSNHGEPALRSKESRGSLISFSGSVHSFTSLTYRSASGEIKTEHAETVSNVELSRGVMDYAADNRSPIEKSLEKCLAGVPQPPQRHEMLPSSVSSTQTFATSPTNEELDKPPRPGQVRDGPRKPDEQSPKLTPESRTSLDSQDGSRRDYNFPGNSQRLHEADTPSAIHHLDASVQDQTQLPVAAKMDEEAGLRPIRPHEDSPLGLRSSVASSNSHQDLIASDPRVTYLDNKLVRLRWKCVCHLSIFVLASKNSN